MASTGPTLTELARLGFADLSGAAERLATLPAETVPGFAAAADPDGALERLLRLQESAPDALAPVLADEDAAGRLLRVLGASEGLATFLARRPAQLDALLDPLSGGPERAADYRDRLRSSVDGLTGEEGQVALRVAYRRELLRIAAWDLSASDPASVLESVAAGLADLAGAALDAALDLARVGSRFPAAQVAATRLAIIGMGKAGARELNYVSDVDVVFVGESADRDVVADDRAVEIATRLAMDTMRGIQELAIEPALWEVDPNLRPEGKDGALVRTLESHLAYYDR